MFIKWDDAYEVGLEAIDAQHKQLVEYINDLHAACERGDGLAKLDEIALDFSDYTVRHFAMEEQYMDRYKYDEYDKHIEQHMRCSIKAVDFFADSIVGQEENALELLEFMKKWFLGHVMGTDKRLAAFLREQGVV